MVPRPDMVTVSADFRVDDVMEVMILNGLSRVPAVRRGHRRRGRRGLRQGPDAGGARRQGRPPRVRAHARRPLRARDQAHRRAAAGDAGRPRAPGGGGRRVRRHGRPGHPRGPDRGAGRRDPRRVRPRRGRRSRTWAAGRCGSRPACRSTRSTSSSIRRCPTTATGTPSAASSSTCSATFPPKASRSSATAIDCGPSGCSAAASGGCAIALAAPSARDDGDDAMPRATDGESTVSGS